MGVSGKVVLVTGANCGLGFEAAAQLVDAGAHKVILACRTLQKAETARAKLVRRCGRHAFGVCAIDTAEADSGIAAAEAIAEDGDVVDVLLLNAGAGAQVLTTNSTGIDLTFASTLVGHHALTVGLLRRNALHPTARILISGSEAARGDLPGMNIEPVDFREVADEHHDGDLVRAMMAAATGRLFDPYDPSQAYAVAKSMVAWWAAALAERLPLGMAVFAVSPGAAPGTRFARNLPFVTRAMVMPITRAVGPVMGMTGSVKKAAKRYLVAADMDLEHSGAFFASRPGRMVGPMVRQTQPPHLVDPQLQAAFWPVIVSLTGVDHDPADSVDEPHPRSPASAVVHLGEE